MPFSPSTSTLPPSFPINNPSRMNPQPSNPIFPQQLENLHHRPTNNNNGGLPAPHHFFPFQNLDSHHPTDFIERGRQGPSLPGQTIKNLGHPYSRSPSRNPASRDSSLNRDPGSAGTGASTPPRSGRAGVKRRQKYSRTRTGCLCCRARRIKCDEERPVCRRCVIAKKQVGFLVVREQCQRISVNTPRKAVHRYHEATLAKIRREVVEDPDRIQMKRIDQPLSGIVPLQGSTYNIHSHETTASYYSYTRLKLNQDPITTRSISLYHPTPNKAPLTDPTIVLTSLLSAHMTTLARQTPWGPLRPLQKTRIAFQRETPPSRVFNKNTDRPVVRLCLRRQIVSIPPNTH